MASLRSRGSARRAGSSAASKVEERKLPFQGWRTSDEEEVERRRLRAATEPLAVRNLEAAYRPFATYAVSSSSAGDDQGREYRVEIRSLDEPWNTCSCPDHRVNGLGTCKHIEAVLRHLARRRRATSGEVKRRAEIFLDRAASPPRVRLARPAGRPSKTLEEVLAPFFGADGTLLTAPEAAVPALVRRLEAAPSRVRERLRLSAELLPWAEQEARRTARRIARERFVADVEAGKRSLDLLRHPLYPYQREGALHLAFAERALLGDEMGLGKTVQAIAACELVRHLEGVERVLVVCPVSLKTEWEEQIAKFTDLPTVMVMGPRPARLRQYRERAFFYLTNYEQILADGDEIQRLLAPDVVILDEAQRIKNWRTKTAQAVKRLESRYAFVLTGTPLENRIDDLYSIVQFLDPQIFGPLFRFNRDFHDLDERGRPVGYKNLAEMHRRLRPVLLRRRKEEVERQLPDRTINTYFVPMHKEQKARYGEYEMLAARLAAIAKRRPLTRQEFEKLQKYLACMRMLCDTPYILDADCRVCPKLGELEPVLEELVGENGHKVLVFSEWERMLELVRELAVEMRVGFAWHTGSVPQPKRREEIRRFKDDPDCRLFLSTDSGGLGLNLQAASAVVNLDLPWNPARLEQRIARAWRKHQQRSVQVINLVTEESIEHNMLGILAGKQTLADGVLDARGGVDAMPMPSGRAGFLERLEEVLELSLAAERPEPAPEVRAPERLRQDLSVLLGERLLLLDVLPQGAATAQAETVLAVVDRLDGPTDPVQEEVAAAVRRCFGGGSRAPRLELLDRAIYETLLRLADSGLIRLTPELTDAGGAPLHRSPALSRRRRDADRRRLTEARKIFDEGERKLRMATLLAGNGFDAEALAPLSEAMNQGLLGLARLAGIEGDSAAELESQLSTHFGEPAIEGVGFLNALHRMQSETVEATMPTVGTRDAVERGEALFQRIEETLDRAALTGGSSPSRHT